MITNSASYNPDVLSCLANLSNDEVFTPPDVVNDMLDMLPDSLWQNPDATFLDPCCKTGVFLREIAKRLNTGLASLPEYAGDQNLQKRLDHIFKTQLYGIAITELTSLLSRRSVYCSKTANGKYSVTTFDSENGHIYFSDCAHTWQNGKCTFCGASESEYGSRENLESHAYQFIHNATPEVINNMKFDVIIGNPPYQMSDGGFGDSAKPIYNLFVDQAKRLHPQYITMIIPARWYSGGKGLDDFRTSMLSDKKISIIHDFPETSDCFPCVNIRGGICFFLWKSNNISDCTVYNHKNGKTISILKRPLLEKNSETFIRYNAAINILHKIQKFKEPTMEQLVSSRKPFGLATNFEDYSEKQTKYQSIKIYRNGGIGYVNSSVISKGVEFLNQIKLIVAKASPGSDDYPHLVFSEPIIANRNEACTETYLIVSCVKSISEAKNLKKYMSTKFFRFLVLLIKNTQDVPKRVYSYVPQQNLTQEWDDEKLYKKYSITPEEASFINTLVKDVDWSF